MVTEQETTSSLISKFESQDGITRVKARKALVAQGRAAVPSLVEAMQSKNDWQRWEAAKTLAQIGDSTSIQALIAALEDEDFSIRWLAAEGLTNIGSPSLVPLLEALVQHSGSTWLREGVHHVLHDSREPVFRHYIRPVILALEDPEPSLKAGIAAKVALDEIRRG